MGGRGEESRVAWLSQAQPNTPEQSKQRHFSDSDQAQLRAQMAQQVHGEAQGEAGKVVLDLSQS